MKDFCCLYGVLLLCTPTLFPVHTKKFSSALRQKLVHTKNIRVAEVARSRKKMFVLSKHAKPTQVIASSFQAPSKQVSSNIPQLFFSCCPVNTGKVLYKYWIYNAQSSRELQKKAEGRAREHPCKYNRQRFMVCCLCSGVSI